MSVTEIHESTEPAADCRQQSPTQKVDHCVIGVCYENPGLAMDEVEVRLPSKINGASLHFREDRSSAQPINIKWKSISFTTKTGVSILKGLSGSANSGELTAIMGPSGAGKTTLLNILSGFVRQNVTGKVLVNDVELDLRTFRKLSCYVLQDDHLFDVLTVKEIIHIAAALKIPTSVSSDNKKKIVDATLKSFGLEDQRNRRISELSGGQRKRVSIAQEVVNNPPLIFLDEPTSGLDSSSCLQCIQLLKALAKEGRTVVCTIHQPSSRISDLFDNLYVVADGQCIYRGPTKELVPFLTNQGLNCPQYHNPTDYVIEVAMGDYGDINWKLKEVCDSLDKQDDLLSNALQVAEKNESFETSNIGYATSSFNQFRVLYKRSVLCLLREKMGVSLKLLGNVVVGLFLGCIFYGIGNDASKLFSNISLMFCSLMFSLFASGVPYILAFPSQRKVFLREHSNCWYSTKTYFLSQLAADFPFQVLLPTAHFLIVYFMSSQPLVWFRVVLSILTVVLNSMISESFGYLFGSFVEPPAGIVMLSSLSILLFLFSGFFIPINTIPSHFRWLSYASYVRYTFQNMILILYTMDRPKMECSKDVCPFEEPETFVKDLGMEGDIYLNFSLLIALYIALKIVTYFVLKFKATRKL